MNTALKVTFKSNGKSGREWTAVIDLGSKIENAIKASKIAWQHNAKIIG